MTSLIAQSAWRRDRLLIFCYHGVSLDDEHRWNPDLYVSRPHLEQRLALLRRAKCTVLRLDEALERLYRNDLPDRAVALTFDDGYHDFMASAWPLLSAAGQPATVYLTTGRVDHNFPIVRLFVSYAVWKARVREIDATGIEGLDGRHALGTAEDRERFVRRIAGAFAGLDATAKDELVRRITARLGLDYDALRASRLLTLMAPADVARLAHAGVDFQLHTHLHRTPDDPELFLRDVVYNRNRIEAITGTPTYPPLLPERRVSRSYLSTLAREGITSATTCDPGLASRESNPLLLPRIVDTMRSAISSSRVGERDGMSWLPRRTTRAHPPVH